jgi:hypothetical protein
MTHERITEADLQAFERRAPGPYDWQRALVELRRLRLLIVRGVEAEKDMQHPGALEVWAALLGEDLLIRMDAKTASANKRGPRRA